MKTSMNRIKYGCLEWPTEIEIQGLEYEVIVYYENSPPEPDVGWAGDLTITDVVMANSGRSMIESMTDFKLEQLIMSLERYESERNEDPRY